jgi:hypothetical protein
LVAFTSGYLGEESRNNLVQTLDQLDGSSYVARLPQKCGGFEEGGHQVTAKAY